MPFFSIVIPTYNRSDFLKRCIESVLNQTFSDFEIIVVNDGSTDDTVEMFNRKFRNEHRCRLVSQVNSERGVARNNGLKRAQGDYVVFLDSDDLMIPDHLSTLHQKIIERNFPNFIATKFDFVRNGKRFPSPVTSLSEGEYDYLLFLNGNPIACNVCVKRTNPSLHLFVEDRDYAIKEDWMFLFQNTRQDKIYLVDKATVLMSDHNDRSMRGDNKLIIQKTWRAIEWIKSNVNLSDAEKKELQAHGNYFSAIHSYIDGDKKAAIKFINQAIRLKGWREKYLVLLLKIRFRKLIRLIKPNRG